MRLGRVVGRVWATVKSRDLEGRKLLVIQPITVEGQDAGRPLIAADAVGAGAGERIYWSRGGEAVYAFLPDKVGVDAAVVGIVDSIDK
jgi:ethanolamine utilization protein EutN